MEVWKELELDNSLKDNEPYSSVALQEKIEGKYPKTNSTKEVSAGSKEQKANSRVLSAQSHSYFNQHEEDFLVESAACLARMGFPLEKNNLHLLCSNYLKADNPGIVDSVGLSLDTVQRIYKDDNMLAKDVENIDPKRASQADPQVLNCFYHQLDAAVAMAHEVRPNTWPARYADMLPTCLYNTDEQGPNPTKLRNPVLIPADMLDTPRLFQLTREGDNKMPFHYSVANIVRADGAQCIPHQLIEGAPAPMILIADPNSGASDLDTMDKQKRDKVLANQIESDDVVTFNPQTFTGWFNDFEVGARATIVNKFGFKLRATPTGSMLKRTFYDFMLHFKDQLPHNQGAPEKQGVILFLDWHSSRECPQSLLLAFIKWNILVIVLPSKTSIWSQPCDNGKNETTAMDIAKASHDQGILSSEALDYETANRVFRAGLEANCLSQNDERRKTGTNAVVSSFAKTGLYPMSYENQGWNNAYKQFGLLNQLLKKKRQEEGNDIPTITWIVKPIPIEDRESLSETEKSLIRSYLEPAGFLLESLGASTIAEEIPLVFLAASIAQELLGNHTRDPSRTFTEPPKAKEPHEIAALKLVAYVPVTVNDRVDTTCTLPDEIIQQDAFRTMLALMAENDTIYVQKKESSKPKQYSLTKRNVDCFHLFDGDRRASRSVLELNTEQVLLSYSISNDDERLYIPDNLKRKHRQKLRIARKKQINAVTEEAIEIGKQKRKHRNLMEMNNRMDTDFSPSFRSGLQQLLAATGKTMNDFYDMWESQLFKPYSDTIEIEGVDSNDNTATTKIDVSIVGSDVSAINYKLTETLLDVIPKMKEDGKGNKRKRKRGAGQSTKLGGTGVALGILIQKTNTQQERDDAEGKRKAHDEETKRLKALLQKIVALQEELPEEYWKCEKLKGGRRETLSRLFGVYKSKKSAQELADDLNAMNLSKVDVDTKIEELKTGVALKEKEVATILATIREQEDLLDAMDEAIDGDDGD
jgi:hypothetical protein